MQKVLVIVGPTAIGKTGFSIEAAKRYDGEIISGDSVQVYRGFDIGSGKISKEDMQGIRHYLIDMIDYHEEYNVALFQKEARKAIEEIAKRGHLPMIVGGTGLYIKATLYDYTFDEEKEADNPYDDMSNEDIYARLKEVDPECLNKIHINNRKRLVRALNIYEKNNRGISENIAAQRHEMIYDALIIGLTTNREAVYTRINNRVDEMINNGLVEEIRSLLDKGVSFDDKPMEAIGYRQFREYFEGDKSLEMTVKEIKRDTRRFAKRQYTWFNNQTPIEWFDIDDLDKAFIRIGQWLDE